MVLSKERILRTREGAILLVQNLHTNTWRLTRGRSRTRALACVQAIALHLVLRRVYGSTTVVHWSVPGTTTGTLRVGTCPPHRTSGIIIRTVRTSQKPFSSTILALNYVTISQS